jgi:hypothetical protein
MTESGFDWLGLLWALGVLAALAIALGATAPLNVGGAGHGRRWRRVALVVGAVILTLAANMALYRRDAHLDVTRERAFTPSAETARFVAALDRDVELTYFYQKQNQGGAAAKTVLEILARSNAHLKLRTVDPDQNPGLANRLGMRVYNTALITVGERRIEVTSTDDREIVLGIVRLLRTDERPLCFATGHGQYDIDNFEFHTHFEGSHAHSHDAQGMALVQMEQHGLGRLKRALEKLGYASRKVNLALEPAVPRECALWVEANPRHRMGPPELSALGAYLDAGGAMLWLLEPDYEVDAGVAALLGRAGIEVRPGVIVDSAKHYYTDEQMVAVTQYANHPSVQALGLSFFPGARPLAPVTAPGVKSVVLFATSATATVIERTGSRAAPLAKGVQPLAIASEGPGVKPGTTFRVLVAGDADFASNSFFPYLANADLVLGLVAWTKGEARGPAMKPPVEVLPTVVLTNDQMRGIFIVTVAMLPGLIAAFGAWVWWRRRW